MREKMAHLPNHKKSVGKLFVFHTEFIFTRGGEKYLYEILKRISSYHETTLYVHKINPYWRSRFIKHGVNVKLFWTPKRFYWLLLPFTLFINLTRLKKEIPHNSYIFATNFPVNTLAVWLSKRTICHCFEPLGVFYDKRRINSLPLFSRFCITIAKWLYSSLDKLTVKKSAILTTLNTSVVPHIMAVYHRQPDMYIANGIDVGFFKPRLKKRPNTRFIIGHSTDYTVFKGTEEFIAGLAKLKNKARYQAYITETRNDQSVSQKYEQQVQKLGLSRMVHFVGNLTEKKLLKFYQSLNVFCYTGSPHSAGGSTASLSVLEAQACGIPVIRSIGNTDEIVSKKTGFYINPDDADDIARKIIQLSANKELCQAMGQAARNHILANHSWEKSVSQLQTAISQIQGKNL